MIKLRQEKQKQSDGESERDEEMDDGIRIYRNNYQIYY